MTLFDRVHDYYDRNNSVSDYTKHCHHYSDYDTDRVYS